METRGSFTIFSLPTKQLHRGSLNKTQTHHYALHTTPKLRLLLESLESEEQTSTKSRHAIILSFVFRLHLSSQHPSPLNTLLIE